MTRAQAGLLLIFLFVWIPARASEILKQTIAFEARERAFTVYVPDIVATPPPLVVLLCGSGEDGSDMMRRWLELARREHIALLAPEPRHADAWRLADDGPAVIDALVRQVRAEHAIDPRRIYLTGQSGGAVYALALAMLESEYFAAVAVHAGGWRSPDEFKAMQYATRKIPLEIVVGDRDEFFSLDAVHKTEGALHAAGFPFALTIIEGHHHAYDERAPEITSGLWEFLRTTSLGQDPKFTAYRLPNRVNE